MRGDGADQGVQSSDLQLAGGWGQGAGEIGVELHCILTKRTLEGLDEDVFFQDGDAVKAPLIEEELANTELLGLALGSPLGIELGFEFVVFLRFFTWRRADLLRRPWRRAFMLERAFPSSVRGPPDRF